MTHHHSYSQTNLSRVTRVGLAAALALAVWCPQSATAAEMADGKGGMDAKMMDSCKEMMQENQKAMAETKAQDAQLGEQVAKMNSAPDDKKVTMIAAIVTRMVEQRAAMDMRAEKMQEKMMQHMMKHMAMGNESMMGCPMMKGMDMKGMDMKGNDMKGKDMKAMDEKSK